MIWLTLLACGSIQSEAITGTIRVGPYAGSGAVSEGNVTIFDEFQEQFDSASIDSDGSFEVLGPAGRPMVAVVEGPGLITSSFSGTLGIGPLEVFDGELFGWPTASHDDLMAAYGDCAGPGSAVAGELRLFGAADENGEAPSVGEGFAGLVAQDGTVTFACYLDEEGNYDPDAERTTRGGEFAFFGVEPGIYTLSYGFFLTEGITVDHDVVLVVREDTFAPLFPAWVDLPL